MNMTPADARQHIDAQRAAEALQGTDEDVTQFRNIVTGAQNVVDRLGERRAALADTGNFTARGLVAALKEEAQLAATNLVNLQANNLLPRLTRLETELAGLGEPTVGEQLDDMERHRLVTAFLDAPAEKKMRMKAEALRNPKLATALTQEDVSVTGLTQGFVDELRQTITTDPHDAKRKELQQKLNAANAAKRAIEGASESIRRAVEET